MESQPTNEVASDVCDIPLGDNECYNTMNVNECSSTVIADVTLQVNECYSTNIPIKANECYGTSAADRQCYTENSQDYEYVKWSLFVWFNIPINVLLYALSTVEPDLMVSPSPTTTSSGEVLNNKCQSL